MNRDQADTLDEELDSYQKIARRACEPSGREPSELASWLRFAAAAGASLSATASAEAAITWVVPPQPIRLEFGDVTSLNLDGVAGDDMVLGLGAIDPSPYYGYRNIALAYGTNGAVVIGDAPWPQGNKGLIKKFALNEPIPAVTPAISGEIVQVSVTDPAYYSVANTYYGWGVDTTGLAGFVVGSPGSRRAGWIKIRTEPFFNGSFEGLGEALEVLEWAYESTPGVSIQAGQTSSVAVPGDYDGNGSVGPEDYTKWKADFGMAVVAGTGSDGNENAKVDAADYTVWRDNLGASGSASLSGAVPEPSAISLGMLALGAAGVTALRRR